MDHALPNSALPRSARLAFLAGFAAMYLPTYWWAATTIWRTEEHAHGAIILIIVAWLFWQRRKAIFQAPGEPAPAAGWSCFLLGVLLYIVGRSQDISIFEMGSQIPILAGSLLLLGGRPAARAAWFPLAYIIFMIPLPGVFVDAVTAPLKQWIAIIAENVLYAAGYPIARSGVVLAIGQYRLLVADACSGLHSIYSLTALGALFMYLTGRHSIVHNGAMAASILPIAFSANVIRVMLLVLLTYHFGDSAGQGFLHGAAGMVLIVAALLFFLLLDRLLARLIAPRPEVRHA